MARLTPEDKQALQALYGDRYKAKGRSHETVGWGSKKDQLLRFEVLMRGLELKGKSVLDVGCGLGDLVPFLDERTGGDYEYLGVDLSEPLIEDAKLSFGGKRREFRVCDIAEANLPRHDIVLLSGALNFRVADNEGYSRDMLSRMFELSRECAASNFLTSYVDRQDQVKNYHYSPEAMFGYAKSLTRWVALHHDYPLWEFTLQLSRNPK